MNEEQQLEVRRLGIKAGREWKRLAVAYGSIMHLRGYLRRVDKARSRLQQSVERTVPIGAAFPFSHRSEENPEHPFTVRDLFGAAACGVLEDEDGTPQDPDAKVFADFFWRRVSENVNSFDPAFLENPNYPYGFALGATEVP